jgi:HTH-type transcriptional regulator/antitoxin HipB
LTTSATLPLITAAQLGQWLKGARQKHGLTQKALANQLGLSQNRVSYLESHPEDLSVRQLLNWCAAVKLELSLGERGRSAADQAEW